MRVTSNKKSNYCLTLKGYRELPLAPLSAGITVMSLNARLEQVLLRVELLALRGGVVLSAPPHTHPFSILLAFLFSFPAVRGNIA